MEKNVSIHNNRFIIRKHVNFPRTHAQRDDLIHSSMSIECILTLDNLIVLIGLNE